MRIESRPGDDDQYFDYELIASFPLDKRTRYILSVDFTIKGKTVKYNIKEWYEHKHIILQEGKFYSSEG